MPDEQIQSIVFGNGRFVAASDSGIAIVSTNGLDWEELGNIGLWSSRLAFGNNIFVALGPDSLATSPDGVTWTMHPERVAGLPLRRWFSAMGVFVATTTYLDDYSSAITAGPGSPPTALPGPKPRSGADRTWRGLAYGAAETSLLWANHGTWTPFIRGVSTNGIDWEF